MNKKGDWANAWLFLILLFLMAISAFADDKPFNNPANWGGTGLMEIPDARVLDDGIARTGYAESRPFKWFTGGMGVFPGLELDFRLTEITGMESGLGEQYGDSKDKAFDLKYQVFPESKIMPAIAFGLHDFHGTRLYPAKYAVFSRQVFPFDLSLGYGTERLKGLFGGIDWALNDYLHVMAEYSPVDYRKDNPVGVKNKLAVPDGADTPINVGLRIKPMAGLNLGISYQRGNTLGISAHIELDVGKEMMPKKPDPMFWGKYENREHLEERISHQNPAIWLQDIKTEVENIGMQDVTVLLERQVLTVKCNNAKYLSNQKAVGRMYRIMLFSSPERVENMVVVLKKRNIPILSASIKRTQFKKYAFGEMDEETLSQLIQVSLIQTQKKVLSGAHHTLEKTLNARAEPTATEQTGSSKASNPDFGGRSPVPENSHKSHPSLAQGGQSGGWKEEFSLDSSKKYNFDWGVKPNLDLYLNDPSGFFKCRVGAAPHFRADAWKGGSVFGRILIPVYSNIKSSNDPMPDAVRSDSWKYSDTDFSLDMFFFDQIIKISKNVFARGSLGYFEQMYAGLSGELLGFIGDGDLAVGLEGDYAIKRAPAEVFKLMDFRRNTLLGNIYYNIESLDLKIHSQYGKFLAEDTGWKFTVTRSYDNGVDIGFWYSFTDTDDMTGFNRGYHDKGVFISIPARVLSRGETNAKYAYSISPWTRDVAASVNHIEDLYGIASDLMPGEFKSDMGSITQ